MGIQNPTNTACRPCATRRGLPTNTHVSKMWVSNVGILPENKTHVLKTWIFLDTMKPTFRGDMRGGSNLFILFRKALVGSRPQHPFFIQRFKVNLMGFKFSSGPVQYGTVRTDSLGVQVRL